MNLTKSLVATCMLLSAVACNNDPAKDKSKAQVAEPVPVTQPATASAGTVGSGASALRFSNADSKITFVGAKVTRKHDGSFGTFSGTIQAVEGKPEASAVNVEIDMASLVADDPKLTGHLKSPDLFDAARFPKARFVSTSVKPGGENGATHTVTGNLDLHGVTKSITFPATIKMRADSVDADADFAINRKDFGVVYPGMPDDLIKDQIGLKLSIRAKKAPPT